MFKDVHIVQVKFGPARIISYCVPLLLTQTCAPLPNFRQPKAHAYHLYGDLKD